MREVVFCCQVYMFAWIVKQDKVKFFVLFFFLFLGFLRMQRTLCLIKPRVDADAALLDVTQRALQCGLRVTRTHRTHLSLPQAEAFYGDHTGKFFFQRLVSFISSGPLVAVELSGPEAVSAWRKLIGPTHYEASRGTGTLRDKYATSDVRNAFHGSGSVEEADREIRFFFGHT